jgi:hypothetical protein
MLLRFDYILGLAGWEPNCSISQSGDLPALQSIHELPRCIEAFAHLVALSLHHGECLIEELGLFFRPRHRHNGSLRSYLRVVKAGVADSIHL